MSLRRSVDVSKLPQRHWFHHASLLSASKPLPASLAPPVVIANDLVVPCDGYTMPLIQLRTHYVVMKGLSLIFLHWEHDLHKQVHLEIQSRRFLELVVVTGLKQTNEKELFTVA